MRIHYVKEKALQTHQKVPMNKIILKVWRYFGMYEYFEFPITYRSHICH